MEPIQRYLEYCCAEQWKSGLFYRTEPCGDGLRLDHASAVTGFYCTAAIDSGENGFGWNRVVIRAQLPPDTMLRVYTRASDSRGWGDWPNLEEGLRGLTDDPVPELRRIFGAPAASCGDFCANCTGRYLWLLLELSATGEQDPRVDGLRIEIAGDHMTDYLPAIYRTDDFTRRFLSIFGSMYADMERAIDALPSAVDYEYAEGELLRTLASWVCVNPVTKADQLRDRIRTALPDYENRFTVEGVRRSVRRLTGKDPILIEHFTVSPNRPDCGNPQLYRRLYGENPYRFFVLLPEGTFASQQARQTFLGEMERLIPAGMSVQLIELKQCVQLDWHTYLGINSRVGGYVPAVIDEQVTIQNDTTIGGASHE